MSPCAAQKGACDGASLIVTCDPTLAGLISIERYSGDPFFCVRRALGSPWWNGLEGYGMILVSVISSDLVTQRHTIVTVFLVCFILVAVGCSDSYICAILDWDLVTGATAVSE